MFVTEMGRRHFPVRRFAAAAIIFLIMAAALIATAKPTHAQTQSNDAALSALTISPKNIIGFSSQRTSYEVGVASTVTQATITPTANNFNATIEFSHTDADNGTAGRQVALSAGRTGSR